MLSDLGNPYVHAIQYNNQWLKKRGYNRFSFDSYTRGVVHRFIGDG